MENDSSLDNESTFHLLPIGALAFAPFLLAMLVAAIVSNAILLALVILACVKKLNNSINIYLFSLAVGGLMGAFNLFCLLLLIVARHWVLGLFVCNISLGVVTIYLVIFTLLFLAISRDKLKGVNNPFHGRPSKKTAYVNSIVFWIVSGILSLAFAWNNFKRRIELYGDFACFGLTSRLANQESRFIHISILAAIYWITSSVIILVTLSNFVRIVLEIRKLKKIRQQFANENQKTIKINGRDKPLYCTGEERTAKSLTLVFFIQFICVLVSSSMVYTQALLRNYVLPKEIRNSADYQLYFVILLIMQHYPCVTPIFLIWSNKRLRTRVKELYKCTLNPEEEASPVHIPANKPIIPKTKVTPLNNNI